MAEISADTMSRRRGAVSSGSRSSSARPMPRRRGRASPPPDDSDDDEGPDAPLDDDELDAIFNDEIPRVGGKRLSTRPVVVNEAVAKKFRQDPEEALRVNVAPYHRPGDLADMRDELIAQADWYEAREQRKDELWMEKDFEFMSLLKGYLPNTAPLVRRTESIAPTARPIMRGAAPPAAPTAAGGGDDATEVMGGPRGAPGLAPVATTREEAEQARIQRNLRAALEMPSVTGRAPISDEANTAINDALLTLAVFDASLFRTVPAGPRGTRVPVERHHFYADRLVMTLFAKLTATSYKLTQMGMPNRAYLNASDPRRKNELLEAVDTAFRNLSYDHKRKGFVFADAGTSLQRARQLAHQMMHTRV